LNIPTNGWVLVGHNGRSIIDSQKNLFKVACQPSTVVRVGIEKQENKGNQSIGNFVHGRGAPTLL
jgi:hypothetical protein